MTSKVLFILKQRMPGSYGTWSYSSDGSPLASGLNVSAHQMAMALTDLGIENKLVNVVDNNSIDREVSLYKPTHVIIEAFWVVPSKFEVLKKLHPSVTWIVRNHSKVAFLAHEGGMIGWAVDYLKQGITVASNSPEATRDFKVLAKAAEADTNLSIYLPNFYHTYEPKHTKLLTIWVKFLRMLGIDEGEKPVKTEIHIGCFGAVRPMKNHLSQAIAAIETAERRGVKLNFYINSTRVEGKADSILRSVKELFVRYPHHQLHELPWMPHHEFVKVIKTMDAVLQVSNSETFNIVAADAVSQGVPVVGSAEIPWLDEEYVADPSHVTDITRQLNHVLDNSRRRLLQADQLYDLRSYTGQAKAIWAAYLK